MLGHTVDMWGHSLQSARQPLWGCTKGQVLGFCGERGRHGPSSQRARCYPHRVHIYRCNLGSEQVGSSSGRTGNSSGDLRPLRVMQRGSSWERRCEYWCGAPRHWSRDCWGLWKYPGWGAGNQEGAGLGPKVSPQ